MADIRKQAIESIKGKVHYDSGTEYILDSEDNLILEVRGFGRLQYLENGLLVQDEVGRLVSEAINEKLNRK